MYKHMVPWSKHDLVAVVEQIRKLKRTVIIAHTDLDGWMAAYSVYSWLIQLKDEDEFEIEHYQWDYGDSFATIDNIEEDAVIFLLDLIFPDSFMNKHADRLVWIDHHQPAIEMSQTKDWKTRLLGDGSRSTVGCVGGDYKDADKRVAACELAHLYFFSGISIPPAISLAGRYDVHDHEFMPECRYLNAYMTTYLTSENGPVYTQETFRDIVVPTFYSNTGHFEGFHHALSEGKSLCEHQNMLWKLDCEQFARIVEIQKRKIIFLNRRGITREYFEHYYQSQSSLFLVQSSIGISTISLSGAYDPKSRLWVFSCYDLDDMSQAWSFTQNLLKMLPSEALVSVGGHLNSCGFTIYSHYINSLFDMFSYPD